MVSLGRSWSCLRQQDGPARLAHAPWHWLRSSPGFLLRLRLNTLYVREVLHACAVALRCFSVSMTFLKKNYVRLFGVMLHRLGPMTLLPPRLAIGLSAGFFFFCKEGHAYRRQR